MRAQLVISSPSAVGLTPEILGSSRCRLELSRTLRIPLYYYIYFYVFFFFLLVFIPRLIDLSRS